MHGALFGRSRRGRRLAAVLAVVVMALLPLGAPAPAGADAPNLVSRNGITVTATRWISGRTLEADIATSLISANAVNGPHRIRITLPNDHFQNPTARYPVVYLLHGGAGGSSAQWTTGGGDAAVRLAQDRPDLFASVASFSGAVDLGDAGTRTVITQQALQNGFPSDGPFGNPFWPGDTVWNQQDPMRRATRLQGVQVLLYAGAGIHDADILERTMSQSTDRFSRTLTANGVPNFWWMYGRPGSSAPYGCDGGHNFGCWNFALRDALPRMLTVLRTPGSTPTPPTPPAPTPAS